MKQQRSPHLLFVVVFCIITRLALADTPYHPITSDEANTIEVYEANRHSVVFVTNKHLRRDPFSFQVFEQTAGSGTGILWDDRGHIVTNFHVIDDATEIVITLPDGSSQEAELIGTAPERDLAVLKIDITGHDLAPIPKGDSDRLTVGHKVIAIGNPFGLDTTLTTGVISALGRTIESPSKRLIRGVIQTDAAINPGSSGGPLINSRGLLIGLNTAIYSPTGASAGISFSIPVNTLKTTVPELIMHGRIQRPVLGIELAPRQLASRWETDGLPIAKVLPGSSAERAGLLGVRRNRLGRLVMGDIIQEINGIKVGSSDDLLTILESHSYGDTLHVKIVRDGEEEIIAVELSPPPQN